jgi:predicted glycosyltransferase
LTDKEKSTKIGTFLIAPLDWGLGHATRCIPLIRFLLQHDNNLIVCGEGQVAALLKKEFPQIKILDLKGYRISYPKQRQFFILKILAQLPKMLVAVRREKKWLNKIIKQHHVDVVISDNRLGLYHSAAHTIFITHQLGIKTGNSLLDIVARRINYYFINKYDECWVPDIEGENSIAGELSHPIQMPAIPVKYIGLLSRFNRESVSSKKNIAVIISGPEPQRTILEKTLVVQLKNIGCEIVLVRGLPNSNDSIPALSQNIKQYNHLSGTELCSLMQESETLITRSGYSTIMDLLMLNKKAILIPTPGQIEQEYLSKYLYKNKLFYSVKQEDFIIKEAIQHQAPLKEINKEVFFCFEKELLRIMNKIQSAND